MQQTAPETTTWTCDMCGKRIVAPSPPADASDPWARVTWDQPAGFDYQGVPWAPRMREPMDFCGACAEVVVTFINATKARKGQPPSSSKQPEEGRAEGLLEVLAAGMLESDLTGIRTIASIASGELRLIAERIEAIEARAGRARGLAREASALARAAKLHGTGSPGGPPPTTED